MSCDGCRGIPLGDYQVTRQPDCTLGQHGVWFIISKVFPPLTFHSGMWGEKTKAWLLVMTPWPRWRSTRRCLQNRIIRMVTNTWRRISSVTARRRLVSLWFLSNQWLCPVCNSVQSVTLSSLWLWPACDSVQSVTLSSLWLCPVCVCVQSVTLSCLWLCPVCDSLSDWLIIFL